MSLQRMFCVVFNVCRIMGGPCLNQWRKGCLFLLGLGLSYVAYPNLYWHWGYLSWICFVPILSLVCTKLFYYQRFLRLWLFFQLFFLCLFWRNPVYYYDRFFDLDIVLIYGFFYVLFPLLFASVFAFFYAVSSFWLAFVNCFFVACLWVLFEFVLTIMPFGFPISLAVSQYLMPLHIQGVTFFGIYWISFLIVLVNCLITVAVVLNYYRYFLVVSGILVLNICLGWCIISQTSEESVRQANIAMIQPSIPWRFASQSYADNYFFRQILRRLTGYVDQVLSQHEGAFTVILPELAITDFGPSHPLVSDFVDHVTKDDDVLVMGAWVDDKNSVVSFDAFSQVKDVYFKSKLVPIFEQQSSVLTTSLRPVSIGNDVQLGSFLCYELLFPTISRELVLNGADFLAGLSFNSWLGTSNWVVLHQAYLPFRAIESGRYALFLNNHGPSGLVDSKGRFLDQILLNHSASIVASVPLETEYTFFVRYPYCFVLLVCVSFIGLGYIQRRVVI